MKHSTFSQKTLANKIATAVVSMTVALGATTVMAASMQPSAEDVSKYLRPMEVPQGKNNISTPERVELGKFLFFDPRLSGSNFISCATCHNPALGWSDAQPTAVGHGMDILERSTPTILNTAYQRFQFWDGRERSLEDQALGPIIAGGEMAQDMDTLIVELKAIPGYVDMFEAAYPGEGVTPDGIAKAISAFERTVVSTDSNFDRWLKGVDGAMSKEALKGFEVFKGKANCTACHDGFNFSDNGFHNVGLKGMEDPGRYAIKPIKVLKGAFKTPTLRDVALTAPYMHNGAYNTLEEVVDHYDAGGFENAGTLDPNMKPLKLSKKEKKNLVEFLKSLTGDPMEVTVPVLPVE